MVILDFNATTPVHPEVVEAMLPYFHEHWGNPSSKHVLGQRAHAAIGVARSEVARLIGAYPDEIIFTSGGTEASNLALIGGVVGGWPLVGLLGWRGVISTVLEHPATLEALVRNRSRGIGFRLARVHSNGQVDLGHLKKLMVWRPRLVSMIHAHNETGNIQPVEQASVIARKAGALFHVDASQSVGKIPVKVREMGVDLLTLAGHKLHAPKGIGALFVKRGTVIQRQLCGAGQENGFRGGTENVPYMVGLGVAARLAMNANKSDLARLRDDLWNQLASGLGTKIRRYTHETESLPNTLFVAVKGIDSASLLASIPGLAASTGAACHDGRRKGSAVLRAMGVGDEWINGTVRLSLGQGTTQEDLVEAAGLLVEEVRRRLYP